MRHLLHHQVPVEATDDLRRFGRAVEDNFGLSFSEKRSYDVWRALVTIASEKDECPRSLLRRVTEGGIPGEIHEKLAECLTIGETYFFREPKTLKAFESSVLPAIAGAKEKRLRIWCAGCSSGEEPYTLSMILHRALPDIQSWDISILGTDINPRVLEKARRGVYSRWSFRGLDDASKEIYFDRRGDGACSVKPVFRRGVSFSLLNLTDRHWRLWNDCSRPDVIFCRNVLIYFSDRHRKQVIERFYSLLPPSGWLVVAPCETSVLLASTFTPVYHGGATLYRKDELRKASGLRFFEAVPQTDLFDGIHISDDPPEEATGIEAIPVFFSANPAECLFEESRPNEAVPETLDIPEDSPPFSREECLENARRLADKGRYEEALDWITKARNIDGADPVPLFLTALIRRELGEEKAAAASLRGALFLDPEFIMAHYLLGAIALDEGRSGEAQRHFRNAESLLFSIASDTLLPEGGGVNAGELLQTVRRLQKRSLGG
jgi:chemotaxis protein methyltransferase CheR